MERRKWAASCLDVFVSGEFVSLGAVGVVWRREKVKDDGEMVIPVPFWKEWWNLVVIVVLLLAVNCDGIKNGELFLCSTVHSNSHLPSLFLLFLFFFLFLCFNEPIGSIPQYYISFVLFKEWRIKLIL